MDEKELSDKPMWMFCRFPDDAELLSQQFGKDGLALSDKEIKALSVAVDVANSKAINLAALQDQLVLAASAASKLLTVMEIELTRSQENKQSYLPILDELCKALDADPEIEPDFTED